MNITITGGAGFIGSHLARYWCRRGARVTVLDNLRTGNKANLAGVDVSFIRGSIEERDLLAAAIEGADIVYHLAAMVSVPESVEQPELCERINTLGTLGVLRVARTAGVKKVILASSSAVYGSADRPIHRESDPPAPESPYAHSKLAGEFYLKLFREHYGLPTLAFRFFNVFGPRQDPNSPYAAAVAIFTARARANQPLVIYGNGTQTRDFIFVEDVVEALALGASQGSGVFNVSCGRSITVLELAKAIIAVNGSKSEITFAPPRPGEVMHSRGDNSALSALGWKPKISLEEGLERTAQAREN